MKYSVVTANWKVLLKDFVLLLQLSKQIVLTLWQNLNCHIDVPRATEEKDHFKTKLKDIALSSFQLFSDNWKFVNNVFPEELNSLKALMRNKKTLYLKKLIKVMPL